MQITIASYVLDVDIEKTAFFYASHQKNTCLCAGCRNFRLYDTLADKKILTCFHNLGIPSLSHMIEIIPYYTQADQTLLYGGFTHICATILKGEENQFVSITDTFQIAFSSRCDLQDEQFPLPIIQIDIEASIPWLLQEKNDY